MIYKLLTIVFALSITSCAIEVGGEDTPQIAGAGIYSGTITADGESAVEAIAIITSNDDVSVVNIATKESFIGTRVDNSLTGTLYASTAVVSTAEITSVSGNSINGTYTSSLGGGTFALTADADLYARTSELIKLDDDWIDTVYTVALGLGASTWNVNSNGDFIVTTLSGCSGFGDFAIINASNNEYAMTMEISNCPVSSYDGIYTGFAILSDTTSTSISTMDSTLTLIFSNGVFGGMAQPLK